MNVNSAFNNFTNKSYFICQGGCMAELEYKLHIKTEELGRVESFDSKLSSSPKFFFVPRSETPQLKNWWKQSVFSSDSL